MNDHSTLCGRMRRAVSRFLRDRRGDVISEMLKVTAVITVIVVGLSFSFYGTGDGALRQVFGPLTGKLAGNAGNVGHFVRAERPTFLK